VRTFWQKDNILTLPGIENRLHATCFVLMEYSEMKKVLLTEFLDRLVMGVCLFEWAFLTSMGDAINYNES
jgi:hypothetical protein